MTMKIFQHWVAIVNGVVSGPVTAREHFARSINETIVENKKHGQAQQICRMLQRRLGYFEKAQKVLEDYIEDATDVTAKNWARLVGFTIQTCSRILFYLSREVARPTWYSGDKHVKAITKLVLHLLNKPKAPPDIKFTSSQYIWCLCWKNEENGKSLVKGDYADMYSPVQNLINLLGTEWAVLRQMAAGALWGLCGNRGSNSPAQKEITRRGAMNMIILALSKTEKSRKEGWEKESFVHLGALAAATNMCKDAVIQIAKPRELITLIAILKNACQEFEAKQKQIGPGEMDAFLDRDLTSLRIAKTTEVIANILMLSREGRELFLKHRGAEFLYYMLQSASYKIKNQAAMTITQGAMTDPWCKAKFGEEKIMKLLVANVNMQTNALELKYNSALAISALCHQVKGPNVHANAQAQKAIQVSKNNQNLALKLGALEKADEFLIPVEAVKGTSHQVVPIKTGLRMITDVAYGNEAIQNKLVDEMFHCKIAHKVLNENYTPDVCVAALGLICALARNNITAQNKIVEHNLSHMIIAKILQNATRDHVRLICCQALHCLSEGNPKTSAEIAEQLTNRYQQDGAVKKLYLTVKNTLKAARMRQQQEAKSSRI
eukprot:CAMPEP_0114517986 /NCGR_PEP_ID=MMETSP0109-20121206/18197_1 /TAXON_ID=29199 /ORGANISM="Chlorarachnion reptans, Strain CCCM449" /LENGTH=605 /DNA_ID=CAMNT_0001698565 /DNA_START=388 /DNA_END=2205 /DNA_ORIENTATION=-